MKIVRNTGTDRVVDLLRPSLTAGRQLDVVTPSLSVFAFSELQNEVASVVRCRLLLPSASTEAGGLGIGRGPLRSQPSTDTLACGTALPVADGQG